MDIKRANKFSCIAAMISAAVVFVCVFAGVIMNLVTLHDENFDHMGIRTFCMFTVNSNILVALGMILVIPFTIDGLRKDNYHLPNWIITFVFMGVTAVALTFLISLLVLSPVKGFVLIFTGSRFFLHGLCPILAIAAFGFFINDHRISLFETFLALIPVFIYACIYFVLAILIGEEHGGWNDFYGFNTYVPFWIPMILVLPLTFGIATLIRLMHNASYDRRKKREADYYSKQYKGKDVKDVIGFMARSERRTNKLGNIIIPRSVIKILVDNSDGDYSIEEMCFHYLGEYLDDGKEAKER